MVDQLAAEATTISADVVLIHIGNNGIVTALGLRADRAHSGDDVGRSSPSPSSAFLGAPNVTACVGWHARRHVHLLDWYAATDGRPDFVVADGSIRHGWRPGRRPVVSRGARPAGHLTCGTG